MVETKFDARFQVVDKLACRQLSNLVDGVIHLFEHQYNDELFFWHGVAEVGIPWNALTQRPPEHSWVERVNVFLEDGRAGQCHILTFSGEKGESGDYARIQLTGTSKLLNLDANDPHFTPVFDSGHKG